LEAASYRVSVAMAAIACWMFSRAAPSFAGGRSNGRPFLGTGGFYPHSFTAVDVERSIAVCPSLTIDSS
jgi:hypothetical protein